MLCFGTFVFLSNISKFELMGPVFNCLEGGEVTSSEVCCGFNYDPGLEDGEDAALNRKLFSLGI